MTFTSTGSISWIVRKQHESLRNYSNINRGFVKSQGMPLLRQWNFALAVCVGKLQLHARRKRKLLHWNTESNWFIIHRPSSNRCRWSLTVRFILLDLTNCSVWLFKIYSQNVWRKEHGLHLRVTPNARHAYKPKLQRRCPEYRIFLQIAYVTVNKFRSAVTSRVPCIKSYFTSR